MKVPVIHKATLNDLKRIHQLGKKTFLESFAMDNNPKDITRYVEEAFALERLTTELSNPESEFYLVNIEEESIGYLKINYGEAQTEHHDMQAVEVERIYVLGAHQGKKVGKQLFDKAFEIANTRSASYLWLGVWERNIKAIKFYHRLGFMAFDKHSFLLGSDLQTDILMQLEVTRSSSIK